jgi:SAM-dependent methyltransferase
MKKPLSHNLLALWIVVLSASLTRAAFCETPRGETLPSYCKSLFPKLLPKEKRPLSSEEIEGLFLDSQLPIESLQAKVGRLSPQAGRDLLEKLILLRWQVAEIPQEQIPTEAKPSLSDLVKAYPQISNKMPLSSEMLNKLTRVYLQDKVWESAQAVALHLSRNASAEERKEIFKTFLGHLDSHDQSWYHQAKIDSLIDLSSGIQSKRISQEIQKASRKEFNEKHQGEETYSFAGPELLLTPYSEILNLFQAVGLKDGQTVVDLGAGFGRVGLALAARYPGVSSTGYEIVKERIDEGARVAKEWGLDSQVHLLEQNLADPQFKPKAADVYFAFNPVSGSTFDKILEDLRTVGLESGKRFRFIVFGPSPFYKTDAQPWLKQLTGEGIPKGDELKIYEFVPEKASHTVIVDPGFITNPYQLRPLEELSAYPASQKMTPKDLNKLVEVTGTHDASFVAPEYLAAWSARWPMEISRVGNQVLVFSREGLEPGKESFVEPLGGSAIDKAKLIEKVISEKRKEGVTAEFSFVSPSVHQLLKESAIATSEEAPDYFDFIYPAENLARLDKSKKLRDRANQAASFRASNPEAVVQIFSQVPASEGAELQKSSKEFLDSWLKKKTSATSLDSHENAVIETETAAAKVLTERLVTPQSLQIAVRGAPNEQGNRPIVAYASGEIRNASNGKRTLILYVQKSDGTKNAIPFINQELAREVVDHPERYGKVDYINMMDASNPGLRQFKMQYEPDLSMGKTYRVTPKN